MSTPLFHGGSTKLRHGVLHLMIHSVDPLHEEMITDAASGQMHRPLSTSPTSGTATGGSKAIDPNLASQVQAQGGGQQKMSPLREECQHPPGVASCGRCRNVTSTDSDNMPTDSEPVVTKMDASRANVLANGVPGQQRNNIPVKPVDMTITQATDDYVLDSGAGQTTTTMVGREICTNTLSQRVQSNNFMTESSPTANNNNNVVDRRQSEGAKVSHLHLKVLTLDLNLYLYAVRHGRPEHG